MMAPNQITELQNNIGLLSSCRKLGFAIFFIESLCHSIFTIFKYNGISNNITAGIVSDAFYLISQASFSGIVV